MDKNRKGKSFMVLGVFIFVAPFAWAIFLPTLQRSMQRAIISNWEWNIAWPVVFGGLGLILYGFIVRLETASEKQKIWFMLGVGLVAILWRLLR